MATILDSRLAKLRALIVDDMQAMRQNMRTQLGQLGIAQVDQAATPDDAIKYIRRQVYDVIVCDYNLNRETNGQQLLEYVRSQQLLSPTTMFIMVSGESSYDHVASAAEFQPDAYMVKPLTGARIADRIERLLDKQNALKPITDRLRMKDLPGALAECDRVAVETPKWAVDILKLKGAAALEMGLIDRARDIYLDALALRDDMVWARLGLARCEQANGRLDEAKAIVRGVLEQSQQYVGAYDLLAQLSEAQGNHQEALNALNQSTRVVPSARRSRLVGEAAYRAGDLEQARTAYEKAISHTRGSLTAQPGDALALAQVHVDAGAPEQALTVLGTAAGDCLDVNQLTITHAAIEAQALAGLGETEAAVRAFEKGQKLLNVARADTATLTLAKAAFAAGRNDDGAAILSRAVRADHENQRMVALARRVLADTGNEALASTIDDAISYCTGVLAEASRLMREGQFDASLAKLEETMRSVPENTGVLLAAAQLHLLWMSQKGMNRLYAERVNGYLAKLDILMPGSERVSKMYRFLRETLVDTAGKG